MKIYFPRDGINYRGEPQCKGTVLEVTNPNDQSGLLAGGCEIFKEQQVPKVTAPKKRGRPKKMSQHSPD